VALASPQALRLSVRQAGADTAGGTPSTLASAERDRLNVQSEGSFSHERRKRDWQASGGGQPR